jgi:hypothetical protein
VPANLCAWRMHTQKFRAQLSSHTVVKLNLKPLGVRVECECYRDQTQATSINSER